MRRRGNDLIKEIGECKHSLKSAIDNLDLEKGARDTDDIAKSNPTSFLDCAISISLNFLELSLYERIISGNLVGNGN